MKINAHAHTFISIIYIYIYIYIYIIIIINENKRNEQGRISAGTLYRKPKSKFCASLYLIGIKKLLHNARFMALGKKKLL